jgi:hypothetical protein
MDHATNIGVSFSLDCWSRHDEDANVLVGYIPALRLYSQGRDDEELTKALTSAAEMFIVCCYGKNILGKVLRDRGMTKATTQAAAEKGRQGEFIAVSEYASSFEKPFKINVPIELIAGQAA